MRIAVEAHALSQEKITGVGKVILHYLDTLQKIDRENEYFIYTMDDIRHIAFSSPLWRYVDFDYLLKRVRMRIRARWLRLRDGAASGPLPGVRLLLYRLAKIILESIDEIVFSLKLASSLKKNGIGVYIGTSTYYYPYFFFSPVKKAGIIYDLVWELYPETMELGNRIRMRLFTLRYMKKLDLMISISENTKKDAREILGLTNRIDAIPLAADREIFFRAPAASIASCKNRYGITKKYILSVCTLEPRKNLRALIEAYRMLPSRHAYQLVLVGMTGWLQSGFFKDLESSDVNNNVIFTGYVSNDDLAPLYSGADLFVFPTLYEGFGLPVLEAMQCGCPVITSNNSSIPEVAGDSAIMIDPHNIDSLAEAMEKLLINNASKRELSKKGLRRAKQFSWDTSAKMLLSSLRSITHDRAE